MDQMNNSMDNKPKVCGCPHHKTKPIATILAGLTLVLVALNVLSFQVAVIVFGVLIIVVGLVKLMGSKCKCCSGSSCHCSK